MKKINKRILLIIDILLIPFIAPTAWLLKNIRETGIYKFPKCRNILLKIGVFPIINHYYEPQFDNRAPKNAFSIDRELKGINWNLSGQFEFMNSLVRSGPQD